MPYAIDAIYENGVFRPVQDQTLGISEGQRVRLTIADEMVPDALQLATSVYEGLAENDIDEIEQIALDRKSFFGRRSSS